jgi:regulator of protease activity HflC (stomatin/prohibitin superfamily)
MQLNWGVVLESVNTAFAGIAILALVIIPLFWIYIFVMRGPRAFLGYQPCIVNQFESVIVYRNGAFERSLPAGIHWVRPKNRQFIRVDLRPEVLQVVQGVISADRAPMILRCSARVRIKDPRLAIEAAQNYRDEVSARLQSVVRKLGERRTQRDLHLSYEEFSQAAQAEASQAIEGVGCECLGFDLLHVETSGTLPELEEKTIGFAPH